MTKTVGAFTVDLTPPHPCWVTIAVSSSRCSGGLRLSHADLRDLEYLVKEAIASVNRVLPDKEKI